MTLIKSISGIRGTIGGRIDDNLTPLDTVKFASAYGAWLRKRNPDMDKPKVSIGRDARISGIQSDQPAGQCLRAHRGVPRLPVDRPGRHEPDGRLPLSGCRRPRSAEESL